MPSLREYAARWGDHAGARPARPEGDAPGPINRGVEIDGRVADSPDSLILEQVRAGLAVRMAVLHDLLAADGRVRSRGGRVRRSSAGTAAPTASCSRAGSLGGECVAVTVEDGVIARDRAGGGDAARARARVRRPARPPAHARPRGRGDDRERHRGRRRRRLLRDPGDAEHRSGRRLGRRARLAGRDGARARRSSRPASWPRSRRGTAARS